MRLRLIALGTRMPPWVDAGVEEYARRLRGTWKLELTELPVARRGSDASPDAIARAKAGEARRVLALLSERDFLVALDERGAQPSTLELSQWLAARRADELTFVIGGPDGLASEVLARAQYRWSLSRLTLPHGLVRVLVAEQLYRACMLLAGHPYHRGG